MNQINKTSVGCALCFSLLTACGGGGNDDNVTDTDTASTASKASTASTAQLLRGVFLDSPVQGLQFRTETQQGLTGAEGGFVYLPGESVVFGLGELEFAQVPAQPTMTPMELAGTDDIESPEVVNILRLLQSIDEDGDPDNGIVIPPAAHDNVLAPAFSFAGSVDMDTVIGNVITQTYGVEREIVDAQKAVDHLIDTLSERASDPLAASWDVEFLYLVEDDQVFDGSYLSIREADFELNLNNVWQYGTIGENSGVFELVGDNDRQFFAPGLDAQGSRAGCLASRPYAVAECNGSGQLFSVFDSEAAAKEFSDLQLAASAGGAAETVEQTEPEFQAALTGTEEGANGEAPNPDLLTPEDLFPACSASLVDEDGDQYGWENNGTCYFVTPTEAESTEETASAEETPASTPVEAVPPTPTLVTTTDCPAAPPRAPATFSVFAAEPAGCSWTPFTNEPVWTWGNSNYDLTNNSVTDTVGGLHQGNFKHSCIDVASGKEVIVTAYCEVTVDAAPGVEAITDLFFLTGQSNAASLQTAYDATLDAADQRVFAYTDTGWQVADLHQFWEQDLPGNYSIQYPERSPYNNIAFQVARSIASKSDRVVGLVVLTAPGEGISHWDYNSDFFVQVREKATAALNELPNKNSFDGMLWLQGETDWLLEGTADPGATGFTDKSSDFYLNYYPNKLFQLISNLRSESWFGLDGKFLCAETKKAALNAHLMALNSDADAFSGCAQASDLGTRASDPYGSHFSAESLRILGGRIADVYLGMVP